MELLQNIRNHSHQPLTRQLLTSLLKDRREPSYKIGDLVAKGYLIKLSDSFYLPTKKLSDFRTEPFLLANHLFGPSYVSFDSALSYYGLIPERVYETSSAAINDSKRFDTSVGTFSFIRLPPPYYSFGIQSLEIGHEQTILIASPEKAIFDKIATGRGIRITSLSSAGDFLIENLRIDRDSLRELDTEMMETWLSDTPKRESLSIVLTFIKKQKHDRRIS